MHPQEALQWLERAMVYGLFRVCDRTKMVEAMKAIRPIVAKWIEENSNAPKKESKRIDKRPRS